MRAEVYVGNRGGIGLTGMKAMLHVHDSEIKTLKAETNEPKNDGKELRAQVHTLLLAAEDYRRV